VRPLRPNEAATTFAAQMTPIVDELRQLATDFGIRPYRVFLVHIQWSGTRLGEGTPTEISRRELLPTPRVRDLGSTNEVLRSVGLAESGSLFVDQISAKYAEDDLMGRTPDLQDPAMPRTSTRNVDFFWEVQEFRPGQPPAVPRRYVPANAPTLKKDGFQWAVSLAKQDFDRSRQQTFDRRSA
jgi:hypothetical protein